MSFASVDGAVRSGSRLPLRKHCAPPRLEPERGAAGNQMPEILLQPMATGNGRPRRRVPAIVIRDEATPCAWAHGWTAECSCAAPAALAHQRCSWRRGRAWRTLRSQLAVRLAAWGLA